MMLFFGLLTALSFGIADFLGGLVGRKMSPLTLTLYSQSIGSVVIGVSAVFFGGTPDIFDLAWGAAAGAMLGSGFILYYRALSNGRMGVVAAVTGVWTAIIPFVIGYWLGERPSTMAILGIMLVVVAIALVSSGEKSPDESVLKNSEKKIKSVSFYALQRGFLAYDRSIVQATGAGLWFGLFFVFLGQAQSSSPLWPAAAATVASALTVAVLIPVLKPNLFFDRSNLPIVMVVGLFQTLGTLTFVIAANLGMLSVAGVAGALSPIPTAILAFLILKERATWVQIIGVAAALTGIVMMQS
ncbi:EamA family transporter [Methylophaga pinxianii]|uniref:EamA family transporter n=1 Tax=Methylophaga pinxianii TaxID=2881052 RepID=UPI001CF2F011|nr:EamA family transporter [Methylophaga pinxianii]MCB2426796.1 DMT family transporter [Methylophaga pinxianii]UPH46561.1 DMT family transporter [Methylophaga pinxianii]